MKIHTSIVIEKPASTIFECLCDFSQCGLWSSLVTSYNPVSPATDEVQVGYCYKNQLKLLNRRWQVTYQVIEYVPNYLLTSKTTAGWLPGIISYRLDTQEGEKATRLTYRHEFELVKFFKPYETVLQRSLERQAAVDLANFKDWLESGLYTYNV